MHSSGIGLAIIAIALGAPLLLGLVGLLFARRGAASHPPPPWNWRVSVQSGLLYAIAFNLTFFIQELFLVVPKALTPGLRPTLYHNNHRWEGEHPLEYLFQGTGALAILLSGLLFAWLLRSGRLRSGDARLFGLWMAYHGLFQALPQVASVPLSPGTDVALAFTYLGIDGGARIAAAFAALAAMAIAGLWLTRDLLGLAASADRIASPGARSGFAFRVAALPAFAAIPLIILYRVPRELIEVIAPPIAVTLVGILWLQCGAWRVADARSAGNPPSGAIAAPLLAAAAILAIFQLILRPGIPFY